MIGHQRDILAALGIEVWIPKAEVCQQHQPAIWRDQAPPEILSDFVSEIIVPSLVQTAPVEQVKPAENPVQAQQSPEEIPAAAPAVEVRPMLQIEPFSLEAVSMEHCILLVDAGQLASEQQLLWANIQRAVKSEFSMLQWPFAWMKFQDGRGAASYVSGFIESMREGNKNIIGLGKIPYLESSEYIELASLQEMLDEPKLKKRLWQFMQNKPKDTGRE